MITDDDIKRARELCEAATPGSWSVVETPWGNGDWIVQGTGDPHGRRPICDLQMIDPGDQWDDDKDDANAAFIAASRTLVPALLDEVERLKAHVAAKTQSYENQLATYASIADDTGHERERVTREFKSFHRRLCERFEYGHDDIDWRRDQLSLEEHIARRLNGRDEAIRERDAALSAQRQLECRASALEAEVERLQFEARIAAEHHFHASTDQASLLAALGVTTVPAALDEIRKLRETARAAEVLATTMKEAAR